MYANTGIASDSARASSAERWARLIQPTAKPSPANRCRISGSIDG
jgi:hypothetical protein